MAYDINKKLSLLTAEQPESSLPFLLQRREEPHNKRKRHLQLPVPVPELRPQTVPRYFLRDHGPAQFALAE